MASHGYPSLSTFSRDLSDFLDAHEWALQMMITLQRQLQHDTHPDVPFTKLPMLLRITLHGQPATQDTRMRGCPATRFAVVSQTFHDLDAYARKEKHTWEQIAVLRDEGHHSFIRKYPQYVGQLFVVL